MQICKNELFSPLKKNNPTFHSNPVQNKIVETVKDEALKIAGVAATAIGTAAIALAKKEDSIEEIKINTEQDSNYPELEVIKPLSIKDTKKIFKKLEINDEDVSKFQLNNETSRLFLGIAINVFQNSLIEENYSLEKFLTDAIKDLKTEDTAIREELIKFCNGYKFCTKNNLNLVKQLFDTNASTTELTDNWRLFENFTSFYQFLLDYKTITNKKFKSDNILKAKKIKFPNFEEIEKKHKILQKNPNLKFSDEIYFVSTEDLEKPDFIEKTKLGENYPELNKDIIYEIAKTDLDLEATKQVFDAIKKREGEYQNFNNSYNTQAVLEICKNINKENYSCFIKLLAKARNYNLETISKILEKLTSENIKTFSLFASDEDISLNVCLDIINTDFKLITQEKIESLKEEGFKIRDIGALIPEANEENLELFEPILRLEEIGAYHKATLFKNVNKLNKNLAKEMIELHKGNYVAAWLAKINEDNFDKINIVWKTFKGNLTVYRLSDMFNATDIIDQDFLLKILADERFKIVDVYNNEKYDFIARLTKDNKDLVQKIYVNFPQLSGKDLYNFASSINAENIDFTEEILTDENIEKLINNEFFTSMRMFQYILKETNSKNKHFAKYLIANMPEFCSQQGYTGPTSCMASTLLHSYNGCDDFIIKTINNGGLEKYKLIGMLDTDCWQTAIERKYFEKDYNLDLIKAYSRAENENIDVLHAELLKDAYAKRDLLKTGLEDLTDYDINKTFNSYSTICALDLIGKANLEAAFPMMIDNFEDFVEVISKIKLSPENKALLIQTINPTNTPEYKNLKKEINRLKKLLNKLVGDENLTKINELKKQQAEILEQLEPLKAELKILQTEFKTNATAELEAKIQELKTKIKPLENEARTLGSQAQSIYFQNNNATQIKEIMKEISIKTKEAQTIADSNKILNPQDVVLKTRVIAGLTKECSDEEISNFIRMIKTSAEDKNKAWNYAINKKIFEKINIELDENLSEKIKLSESKYLSELFVSSEEFFKNLRLLISLIKDNPKLSVEEALDTLPANQETKRMFEDLGIDYHAWSRIDKNSHIKVGIELNAEQARSGAIQSLEEDLNDFQFKTLPDKVKDKIWAALAEIGVTFEKSYKDNFVGDGYDAGQEEFWRLHKNGKPIVFNDMPKIVSVIKKTINEDEFWSKKHYNDVIETARETMYEHLTKLRTADVDNAKALKSDETHEIEIHKTDMYDIKKALGLGNDGQCCTALGKNFNEWTAPNYIKHKCIGAIELTDNGNFVGNTMIFLANVDGKTALILDNIELKTKYQYNDKIRDAFMEYAKKLCEEIGKPNMPIYAGPNRHKLTMAIYPKEKRTMKTIGSTGQESVYMDYITGRKNIGANQQEELVDLYKIR